MPKKRISEKESEENKTYNKALKCPVDEKSFFLEAAQGRNINGNVFALLRYIRSQERFDGYRVGLALVPEKFDEARQRLEKYGIRDVDLVEFDSAEYRERLVISKYLITDNSFPAYFYKRPEQVYLNTWHGTPLKALGRTDLDNSLSIANVQANMAKADWLLHPNRFTKDIMMKDYMMERVFGHSTVIMDYPRNDALYKAEFEKEIRERLGAEDKRLIAYMPTWRGSGRDADADEQLAKTEEIIAGLNDRLKDDEVLLVNLHFLIGTKIDFSRYDRVLGFPGEYETYDVLACCDALITDYSSVAIDFAGTNREIILFTYDYEQYKKDKGFYYDVMDLPFKKARTMDELDVCLHGSAEGYVLDASLMSEERGDSCRKVIDLICDGRGAGLEIEDYGKRAGAARIAYFENINRDDSKELIRKLEEDHPDAKDRPVIMFPSNMTPETIETLKSMDRDTEFVRISGRFYCSNDEFDAIWINNKTGLFRKKAEEIFRREAMRNIGQFKTEGIDVMQCSNKDRLRQLSMLDRL